MSVEEVVDILNVLVLWTIRIVLVTAVIYQLCKAHGTSVRGHLRTASSEDGNARSAVVRRGSHVFEDGA